VDLKNHATGEVTTENYDKLVLSPGAAPIRPPLPGIDLPGIFSVRTVPDARSIREWLDPGCGGTIRNEYLHGIPDGDETGARGGGRRGFIGLEMVENLVHRGLEVTLIEKLDQVMPPLDREMARLVERYMAKHGVRLELNDGVAGFRQSADGSLEVLASSGKVHPADIVILAIGVRPETALAKMAGIEIGQRGGIRVDEQMRTSDPDIFAVGDAVEVRDFVTGQWSLVALAGPANRQGRIAADVIAGRDSSFRGTQGTSICKIFEGVVARPAPARRFWSGSERRTSRRSTSSRIRTRGTIRARKCSRSRSSSGNPTDVSSGRRCWARRASQADRFLRHGDPDGVHVYDLEEAELSYAPPFGSAKDPVNFAGMIAANVLRGDMPICHWDSVDKGFLLDVRNPPELAVESVPGALDIRCRNSARAWANSPETARSSSSAAPHSAPTTRRASCCRTGSRPGTSPAPCCPVRCWGRSEMEEGHRT